MRSDPIVTELAQARRARGWSQEQLGEVCGVTQATISRLECGTRQPNLSTLRLLADALGYDVGLCNKNVIAFVQSGHVAADSTAYKRARRESA